MYMNMELYIYMWVPVLEPLQGNNTKLKMYVLPECDRYNNMNEMLLSICDISNEYGSSL